MKPQQTPDNEVARLHQQIRNMQEIIDDDTKQKSELHNEVARLRELNEKLRTLASNALEALYATADPRDPDPIKFREELAALAPAPEEPETSAHLNKCIGNVTDTVDDWKCPHCGSTTGTWFSRVEPMGDICEDCGKAVDEEPVIQENPITEPEWRELGPDEVIQEGDEYFSYADSWEPVELSVGQKVSDAALRIRRPLPNSPEFERIKKQEEMPMDGEIASIEWSCAHTARAIRYLRDEIQKLKATVNKTTPNS